MKRIKRDLNITDDFIADAFGFANANSYRNSTKRNEYDRGIIKFYDLIKAKDHVKITEHLSDLKNYIEESIENAQIELS